jgi:hypothetical protein
LPKAYRSEVPPTSAELFSVAIRWPDPQGGPWHVVGHYAIRSDRPECVGLELWSGCEPATDDGQAAFFADSPPIGAADFRRIRAAELLAALWQSGRELLAAKGAFLDLVEEQLPGIPADQVAQARDSLAALDFNGDSKRRRADDRGHFERVAAIYRQAAQQGLNPTQEVQRQLNASYSSATKWVGIARNRYGLLPKTRPGVPSDPWVTTSKEAGK